VVPDGRTSGYLRQRCAAIGPLPAVEVRRVQRDLLRLCMKRMVDIALSLVGLLLLSPLFLVIAAAIRLETRGPVFFRQARTGYCGRTFRIFKFRTMRVLEDGPKLAQAKRNDPRVTRIGSFLRRSSLDELPQLINVLAGDMSLVGPRPHALAHDQFYDQRIADYTLRQHVLPGITGWAQIHGLRGETSTVDAMRRRVEHDLWYAANGRLRLDLWIMIRTCVEIFRCRNAY
jgi:exopolysaccharide biosynthesis polyprenyl glycosylphosphotransferase